MLPIIPGITILLDMLTAPADADCAGSSAITWNDAR
jgi:hypothetical protein